MGEFFIKALILLGVMSLTAIPKYLKLPNIKLVNFSTYFVIAIVTFGLGKYLLTNYTSFTNTLALASLSVGIIYLFLKSKPNH